MRSWARLILEAATISIALVILRVFCTLLILVRISFDPGIAVSSYRFRESGASECPVVLPVLHRLVQPLFGFLAEVLGVFDALHQARVLFLDVITHGAF